MIVTMLTSQEFCLAIGNARTATRDGPVIIVDDDGKPAHVLLSFEEYQRMGGLPEDSANPPVPSETDGSPWAFMLEALEEFEVEPSHDDPQQALRERRTE